MEMLDADDHVLIAEIEELQLEMFRKNGKGEGNKGSESECW